MKVVFETATIADAIKKAERVAPSKGAAFDKASGIVITADESREVVLVRATNLDVYSMEWVAAVSVEGEPGKIVEWRVPSKLIAGVMAGLPIGSGSQLTLEEKEDKGVKKLFLKCGKVQVKLNLMTTDYFPVWEVFSPDDLNEVDDLGGRIAMVEWAASKTEEAPLKGINFDGELVTACDRYRLVTAPIKIPGLEDSITVPGGILGSVLKQTGTTKIGVKDGYLLIMPDTTTQIRTIVYGSEYPPVERIKRRDQPMSVRVKKQPLADIIQRAATFAGADRFPVIRMFFGLEEITVIMETTEIGTLMDSLDTPGFCDHPRAEFKFAPRIIMEPILNAPNEEVTIHYDPSNPKAFFYIDGGSGYEAWAIPRNPDARPEEN